jgi:hypothetical protein
MCPWFKQEAAVCDMCVAERVGLQDCVCVCVCLCLCIKARAGHRAKFQDVIFSTLKAWTWCFSVWRCVSVSRQAVLKHDACVFGVWTLKCIWGRVVWTCQLRDKSVIFQHLRVSNTNTPAVVGRLTDHYPKLVDSVNQSPHTLTWSIQSMKA